MNTKIIIRFSATLYKIASSKKWCSRIISSGPKILARVELVFVVYAWTLLVEVSQVVLHTKLLDSKSCGFTDVVNCITMALVVGKYALCILQKSDVWLLSQIFFFTIRTCYTDDIERCISDFKCVKNSTVFCHTNSTKRKFHKLCDVYDWLIRLNVHSTYLSHAKTVQTVKNWWSNVF